MRVYIKVKARRHLPKNDELVAVMWKPEIEHSFIGRQPVFSLRFDKWIEDPGLKGIPCPYVEFEMERKIRQPKNFVIAPICDDAPFVDIRAFHKAVLYIAKQQRTKGVIVGKISFDGNNWISPEQYRDTVREYVDCTFDEALGRTITELAT